MLLLALLLFPAVLVGLGLEQAAQPVAGPDGEESNFARGLGVEPDSEQLRAEAGLAAQDVAVVAAAADFCEVDVINFVDGLVLLLLRPLLRQLVPVEAGVRAGQLLLLHSLLGFGPPAFLPEGPRGLGP